MLRKHKQFFSLFFKDEKLSNDQHSKREKKNYKIKTSSR